MRTHELRNYSNTASNGALLITRHIDRPNLVAQYVSYSYSNSQGKIRGIVLNLDAEISEESIRSGMTRSNNRLTRVKSVLCRGSAAERTRR